MKKDGIAQRFMPPNTNFDPAPLKALFELIKNDPTIRRQDHDDNRKWTLDAMRTILAGLAEKLLLIAQKSEQRGYTYYPSSIYGFPDHLQEIRELFNDISELAYSIGKPSIPRDVLREVIQDRLWASSKDLIAIVAKHMAKEFSSGAQTTYEQWHVSPAFYFIEHGLTR